MRLPDRDRLLRALAVALVVVFAYWLGGRGGGDAGSGGGSRGHLHGDDDTAAEVWTCTMHLQVRLPEPGQCPICGMDLVPLPADSAADGEWVLEMSPAARKLAEIETAEVARLHVSEEVRMVGKVEYDETRLKTVSARFGGRLDRLFVDYTGVPVKKGEHLVWLYSPELVSAQEELLESSKRVEAGVRERSEFLRASNLRALDSAREKLRLWGLGDAQIREIEERGSGDDHIMITSPVSGIVAEMWVKEGDYVETGTKIYTVADLEHLWVKLDAYESNLMWLRFGQEVLIEAEAYPGEVFSGRISFIDPVLDELTRTVKVRVNVENHDFKLKPGMFVRGVVRSTLAEGGKVMDPGLAGKWIGPMHPEIVRSGPGSCPVCGMPLVRAEELGFVRPDEDGFRPLVVPVSAVLKTGKRAVVYVERAGTERPTYEGRVVDLGSRAGDRYIILGGLAEGERVVTNGNFKIDSALQIQARPSMMSPPEPHAVRPATRPATRPARAPLGRRAGRELAPVYEGYLDLQEALAADDPAAARAAFGGLDAAVSGVDPAVLASAARDVWHTHGAELGAAASGGAEAGDLAAARAAFARASTALIAIEHSLGHGGEAILFEVHCPMAFDSAGGRWLQRADDVRNPYFGASMLGCGTVEARHPGNTGER